MANPIQYTSRTFLTILADINADPDLTDKPEWFKRMIAGIGDVLSMCLDAQANNTYLETAFTRSAVKKLCALINYNLTEQKTSQGILKFSVDKTIPELPKTFLAKDLCGINSQSQLRYESRADVIMDGSLRSRGDFYQPTDRIENMVLYDTLTNSLGKGRFAIARNVSYGHDSSMQDNDFVRRGWTGLMYLRFRMYDMDTDPATYDTDEQYWIIFDYYDSSTQRYVYRFADNPAVLMSGSHGDAVLTGASYNIYNYTIQSTCYQQETKDPIVLGNSDGSTPWQKYLISDQNVILDTLKITINNETWQRVDDFSGSVATSKHYKVDFNEDKTCYVIFGNGTFGKIPDNFPIQTSYAVGGGSVSNITRKNSITAYAGNDQKINDVTNDSSFLGGADPESIQNAKLLAPATLRTQDRFVTIEDGLVLIYRTALASIAYIWSNYYGSLTCKVNCVARGGGNLSVELRNYLANYLQQRSVLGSVDVHVVDTAFTEVNLTCSVALLVGYTLADVTPYTQIALKLFFTECGKEILDIFQSEGLERAIVAVNTIFGTDFSPTDHQISNMLKYLQKDGYRQFGETIHESEPVAFVSTCVDGINYLEMSDIFPIVCPQDSITTCGTFTVVEL